MNLAVYPRWSSVSTRLRLGHIPALAADVGALGLAAALGLLLARTGIGSGDYGQWLMVSRAYLGQDIPAYRDISSLPPVAPALLAITRLVVHDPILAVEVFRIGLVIALVLSFYAAGTAIFRHRGVGLLSAVFGMLVTDRVLELFAFGGLLQLVAQTFLNFGVAALAQAGATRGLRLHWWALGSVAIALAALSHTGTGVIAVPVGGAVALASALRNTSLSWRQRALALSPFASIVAVLAVYYVLLLLPANAEYAANPASFSYRGPGKLLERLTSYRPTLGLLAAGGGFLIFGALYEALSRRIGGYLVTAAWVLGAWGIFVLSFVTGAATDYLRFAVPLLVPLAVAASGGLALSSERLLRLVPRRAAPAMGLAPLVLAAALILAVGPRTAGAYQREVAFYRMPALSDLQTAALWLDARLPEGQAVLAPTAEGKWIEGLTGREALFSIPVRFSFRVPERERSLAADAIFRANLAVSNEFFFLMNTSTAVRPAGSASPELWLSMNHGGEYLQVVQFPPKGAKLFADGNPETPLATLQGLRPVSIQTSEIPDGLRVQMLWMGERKGKPISYTRTFSFISGSTVLDMVDEVISSVPIKEMQVEVAQAPGIVVAGITPVGNWAHMYFPRTGTAQPHLHVNSPDQKVAVEATAEGKGVLVRAFGATRLHIQFTTLTPGDPIFETRSFHPNDLVQGHNIGAAVLIKNTSYEVRASRLVALGFKVEKEVGPYVLMVREPLPAQGY